MKLKSLSTANPSWGSSCTPAVMAVGLTYILPDLFKAAFYILMQLCSVPTGKEIDSVQAGV